MKRLIVKEFFEPPRHIYKIFILNILGFQIIRVLLMHIKIILINFFFYKYEKINPENYELEKNGFVIIKNFLNNDDFNYVCDYFETLKSNNLLKKERYGNADVVIGPLDNENRVLEIFSKSLLGKYVSNVIYKKIRKLPVPVFQEISLQPNMHDSDDLNSEFHVDRHFPCCKAFFYLNDNSEENGAFEYISGSHLLSFKRLKFEYFYSVFSSTHYFDNFLKNFGFKKKNNRITLVDEKFEKYFGKIVKCSAPKNSLVICNNMGFHRRGKIINNKLKRKHLRFTFYDLQLNPITLKIKTLLKKINK